MILKIPDDECAPLSPVNLGIQAGRYRYAPEGLFGGKEGAKAQFLINGKPGNPYALTQLSPDDEIVMDAAGGGGYGDPLEREPEMIESDVIDGYVSIESARDDYGVVINTETLKVDFDATAQLRETMKKG